MCVCCKTLIELVTFKQWMSSRPEIKVWKTHVMREPESAIHLDITGQGSEFSQVYQKRANLNVLSHNSMLKVDYFPGIVFFFLTLFYAFFCLYFISFAFVLSSVLF